MKIDKKYKNNDFSIKKELENVGDEADKALKDCTKYKK